MCHRFSLSCGSLYLCSIQLLVTREVSHPIMTYWRFFNQVYLTQALQLQSLVLRIYRSKDKKSEPLHDSKLAVFSLSCGSLTCFNIRAFLHLSGLIKSYRALYRFLEPMYKRSEPSGDVNLAAFYSNKLVYHLEANLTFLERKVSNPMISIKF